MSDLISREELMKLWDEYHPYIATRAIQFDQAIRKLPSAEPVRHGKWIKADSQQYFRKHYPAFTCSECGKRKDSQKTWNYCPNCGARMDKE